MVDNKAHCAHGHYQNKELEYDGGFQLSEFHGLGHEKGGNYEFNGYFEAGRRKQGELKWTEEGTQYLYKGPLDENGKFAGRGNPQSTQANSKTNWGAFRAISSQARRKATESIASTAECDIRDTTNTALSTAEDRWLIRTGLLPSRGSFETGCPKARATPLMPRAISTLCTGTKPSMR